MIDKFVLNNNKEVKGILFDNNSKDGNSCTIYIYPDGVYLCKYTDIKDMIEGVSKDNEWENKIMNFETHTIRNIIKQDIVDISGIIVESNITHPLYR